jgi:hypothetical protein
MDPVMARAYRLRAASTDLCARALRACAAASGTRMLVAERVRLSPLRRMARLAQGASDRDGAAETRERRCRFCLSDTVKQRGRVSAADGLIKVLYGCEQCERIFHYVRKAVEFGRETPPTA